MPFHTRTAYRETNLRGSRDVKSLVEVCFWKQQWQRNLLDKTREHFSLSSSSPSARLAIIEDQDGSDDDNAECKQQEQQQQPIIEISIIELELKENGTDHCLQSKQKIKTQNEEEKQKKKQKKTCERQENPHQKNIQENSTNNNIIGPSVDDNKDDGKRKINGLHMRSFSEHDMKDCKEITPFEIKYSNPISYHSKKSYPMWPFHNPFEQNRRRNHSPTDRRLGNKKRPHTYWNNGKLYRRCLEKYQILKICQKSSKKQQQQQADDDIIFYEQKHKQKQKNNTMDSFAVFVPKRKIERYKINLAAACHSVGLKIIQRSPYKRAQICETKNQIINVKVPDISELKNNSEYLIVCAHPIYYVFQHNQSYNFFFPEQIHFISRKQAFNLLQAHISQLRPPYHLLNMFLPIIFDYYFDDRQHTHNISFYSDNFIFDFLHGFAYFDDVAINLRKSKVPRDYQNQILQKSIVVETAKSQSRKYKKQCNMKKSVQKRLLRNKPNLQL